MVVPIGVSADDGRMTGEVFFAEFQAKSLCRFHGQAIVGCIAWVKADDILVALDITMLGVLAILAVCQQAGRCKRESAALKGIEQVGFPQLRSALFIQKLLSSERIVLVNEVRFDGGIVRVFITIRLFKSLATTSSMAKQDNYKKERTETALSFHFSDFGMRGYISMVKPSGLFLRVSFSFW